MPTVWQSGELCIEDGVVAIHGLLGVQEVTLWQLEAECLSGLIM